MGEPFEQKFLFHPTCLMRYGATHKRYCRTLQREILKSIHGEYDADNQLFAILRLFVHKGTKVPLLLYRR